MNVVMRADASVDAGTGHVMRCLALAEELAAGGARVTLASASMTDALQRRLAAEGIDCVPLAAPAGSDADLDATLGVTADGAAAWLVVDGYAFGAEYYRRARSSGVAVMAIDDYAHAESYEVDLLLNQNLYASPTMYRGSTPRRLLLGPRYALLRSEFRRWAGWTRRVEPRASRVLVTLGGTDPSGTTRLAVRALELLDTPELTARVVVGASNATAAIDAGTDPRVEFVRDPGDMSELVAWADVGIGAGGTTSLEFAFLGLPVILFVLAENQRRVTQSFVDAGVAWSAGPPGETSAESVARDLRRLLDSYDARADMARRGPALVDGAGARRVADELRGPAFRLRRATPEDARLLWEWANDPGTRRASFTTEPIPWRDHVEWLTRRLNDPAARLLVAVGAREEPLGQVRFQVEGRDATISVSLAPEHRGHGIGSRVIAAACEDLSNDTPVETVHAYIRPENAASVASFRRAGFEPAGTAVVSGVEAMHLIRRVALT